jgi:hypothetical protein
VEARRWDDTTLSGTSTEEVKEEEIGPGDERAEASSPLLCISSSDGNGGGEDSGGGGGDGDGDE